MGTRGAFGFYIDGKTKAICNHWDSYPSGLGADAVGWLQEQDLKSEAFLAKVQALRAVPDRDPTKEEIELLAPWTDLAVSRRSSSDWYCLLRGTQGDFSALLEAGLYKAAESFLADSLFCEWAYIVNLDDGVFEVYRGFQGRQHGDGRYASAEPNAGDYWPVALVASYPLADIPAGWEDLVDVED